MADAALLTALGVCSLVFTVAFTAVAAMQAAGRGQSPRHSIYEAWTNIVLGFSVNYAANLLLLPLVGAHVGLLDNWWLGWTFTAVSICRQFAIRRWFNARTYR